MPCTPPSAVAALDGSIPIGPIRVGRTHAGPRRTLHLRFVALLSALLLVSAPLVGAQQRGVGDRQSDGLAREQMWRAPSAEDWGKPVLITWQRTWEDALALARETNRPILVCVNMDGEIASEHYAGIRYRQPEIAALYEPYVTVIASVYRHNPRDYDEQGRRIVCPRFGTVTCGEHITIEPILYEKFFDGRRIAPRHVMVELDGAETYDVFYAWDTASVFDQVRTGIEERQARPVTRPRGDRSLRERVASPDVADRVEIETLYLQGDRATRWKLLTTALELGAAAPLDLLRLAIFGLDLELARLARAALAQSTSPQAIDLIVETLQLPMDESEREALIAALDRLGAQSERAQTLAAVHRGLSGRSDAVDVSGWADALGGASYAGAVDGTGDDSRRREVESTLRVQDEVLDSADAAAHLELAESFLETAYELFAEDPESARLYFMDARNTARQAEAFGADGWRLDAALSIAAWYLDDKPMARERALSAVAAGLPEDAPGWNAMAVLAIFAQARQQAIQDAVTARRDWPTEWLSDVNAAYAVLARHPFGTDEQVAAHYDFLLWLGAPGPSWRVLEQGIERFPGSWELHERLRRRVLWARGVDGLARTYDELLAAPDASPALTWFAGEAAMASAEFRRRSGDDDAARADYDRAIAFFERDIALNPEARDDADHQVALALAGRARLAFEHGDDAAALDDLLASFARRPASANVLDGLNLSAVDTARVLRVRLLERQPADALERLDAALRALDPELLQLPAYEKELPPVTPADEGRPGRSP